MKNAHESWEDFKEKYDVPEEAHVNYFEAEQMYKEGYRAARKHYFEEKGRLSNQNTMVTR